MGIDWSYYASLFSDVSFWLAVKIVVELSILAWLIAVLFGFFLALGKLSPRLPLRFPASLYVWFFRSIPLLVLLIFVYNIPQAIPSAHFLLKSPFNAALISLVMSESAYIAEIHRGGLLSVPTGQTEAGKSMGMSFFGIQRIIVFPQAFRIALPGLGNQYVTIVKLTSLASVISLPEILFVGQNIYTRNFKVMPTMLVVAIYYVLIVTVMDNVLNWLERQLDVRHKPRRPSLDFSSQEISDSPIYRDSSRSLQKSSEESNHQKILSVESITKSFSDTVVLDNVSMDVSPGEVISIIGPSGSGKTTLIRTLNGLETPDSGVIRLSGEILFSGQASGNKAQKATRHQAREFGMVFQNFNLLPHRSVIANVEIGPRYHGFDSNKAIRNNALSLLKKVGLLDHADKYPHEISGGQQQRVAIARALAMQPSVLLFDEPTSALDPELVGEVLGVIGNLAQEGLTMLIVTHEMQFAYNTSDSIIVMDKGHIIDRGSPSDIFDRSDDTRTASFLRHSHVQPSN